MHVPVEGKILMSSFPYRHVGKDVRGVPEVVSRVREKVNNCM